MTVPVMTNQAVAEPRKSRSIAACNPHDRDGHATGKLYLARILAGAKKGTQLKGLC